MAVFMGALAEVAGVTTAGQALGTQRGERRAILIQSRAANTANVRIFFLQAGQTNPATGASYLELAPGGLYNPPSDQTPSNALFVKSASGTVDLVWGEG